jgi:hypothetical protein
MDTKPAERGFIPYPTNRVVGTIADAEHADAAVKALVEAGFDRNSIDVLNGEDDLSRLDPTGTEHGVLERLQRAVIRTGRPVEEYQHLMRHVGGTIAPPSARHTPTAWRGCSMRQLSRSTSSASTSCRTMSRLFTPQ